MMISVLARRIAALSVLGFGLACGSVGPAQASDWQNRVSLQDAAKAFDDAALRINTSPAAELARWTSPIFLAIVDKSGMSDHASEAEASVRAIAAVARVSVTRVSPTDPRANFVLRASDTGYDGKPPCRSSVDWTGAGSMTRIEIRVNLVNPGRITRCINHEVMHGFGFRGHPHGSFSVLSYKHANQAQLTDVDLVMLEALYDPRLQPGMKPAAASALACSIMAEKIHATPDAVATVCGNRGAAPKRELVAFGGSRGGDDAKQVSSLRPGYTDGGY